MSITLVILITTILVSVLSFDKSKTYYFKLLFNAVRINYNKEYYRFFSYGLVHADFIHLAVNAYVLFSFGGAVEDIFVAITGAKGHVLYLLMYVGALISSVIPSFEKHKTHSWYNAVGASGAVSAIVFSFIILQPSTKMGLLFIPIMIPAWIFGLLYLFYSYYMSKKGSDNIGHDVHLFGALFGIIITLLLDARILGNFLSQLF
ncbi:MAG: rhomboid family intramembrane serine protease [Bacteroidota bacterium]